MIRTRRRWGVEPWPLVEGVWVERSEPSLWPAFRDHHYLHNLNPKAMCYIAVDAEGDLLGFVSALPQPARFGGYYREHRLVVLPGQRGRGVGVALSLWLGDQALASGHRYFSRTRNETVAAARDRSPAWRRVRHTGLRTDSHGRFTRIQLERAPSTGHEYMGRCNGFRLACQQCGRLFETKRAHARYCDVACRVAAHRAGRGRAEAV